MSLFGNKSDNEEPLFETSYLGFRVKVFSTRVEYKQLIETKTIPINQIASVELGMPGLWQVL